MTAPGHPAAGRHATRAALAELTAGGAGVIAANPDRRSREMGLAPGAAVRVTRNHRRDHALVIALGDARFFISRRIAEGITVEREIAPRGAGAGGESGQGAKS